MDSSNKDLIELCTESIKYYMENDARWQIYYSIDRFPPEGDLNNMQIFKLVWKFFEANETYKFEILFDILFNQFIVITNTTGLYNFHLDLIISMYTFCIKLHKFELIKTLLKKYCYIDFPKTYENTFISAYLLLDNKQEFDVGMKYLLSENLFITHHLNFLIQSMCANKRYDNISNDLFAEFIDHGLNFCNSCKNKKHDFVNKIHHKLEN
jgi:hypothetical protein